MARHKHANGAWTIPDSGLSLEHAQLAVLMDIRDEMQAIRRLAECPRIPRALDAMHELGVEARRKKRAAAKRRKSVA